MLKLWKILADGTRMPLSVSVGITVAGDGLSFTHTSLVSGDNIEWEYEFDSVLSTTPLIEYSYTNDSYDKDEVDAKLALKANKAQEAWINLTMLNGWIGTLKIAKSDNGFVTITGEITAGTITGLTQIATIPTGYLPPYTAMIMAGQVATTSIVKAFFASAATGKFTVASGNELTAGGQYRFTISYHVG